MSNWEIGLLMIAGYVAVTGLVRLMRWKRTVVLNELRREVDAEKQRQLAEEKAKKKTTKGKQAA